MNRSSRQILLTILFLSTAAHTLKLCEAQMESVENNNNTEFVEELTDAKTLAEIEEENDGTESQDDLTRQSRHCKYGRLNGCGGGGSIGASGTIGTHGAIGGGGSIGTNTETGIRFNAEVMDKMSAYIQFLQTSYANLVDELSGITASLPRALNKFRMEVLATAPRLKSKMDQTYNTYVRTEKRICSLQSLLAALFPHKNVNIETRANLEVPTVMDKIKTSITNVLATFRSIVTFNGALSVNNVISKLQNLSASINASKYGVLNNYFQSSYNGPCGKGLSASGGLAAGGGGQGSAGGSGSSGTSAGGRIAIPYYPSTGHLDGETEIITTRADSGMSRYAELENVRVQFDSLLKIINQLCELSESLKAIWEVFQSHFFIDYQTKNTATNFGSILEANTNANIGVKQALSTRYTVPRIVIAPQVVQTTGCSSKHFFDKFYSVFGYPQTLNPGYNQPTQVEVNTNANIQISASDIVNSVVILQQDDVAQLFNEIPQPGVIIVLNLSEDIMLIGSPVDNVNPILFNCIFKGVTAKARSTNKMQIWNYSSDDFECNQNLMMGILNNLAHPVHPL